MLSMFSLVRCSAIKNGWSLHRKFARSKAMIFCRPFPLTEFLKPKNPDHNLNIYIPFFFYIYVYISYHIISYHITSYISYHIISYHIISYHIISYHIISYHIISYHIISYHIISYHIISYHIISYHIISYHIISYHIISYHIISYHIISYHIISYHIISYHIYIYINSIHIPLGFLRVSFHVVEQCRTFQLVHLVASFAMMFVWVHAGRKRAMQGYFHHLVGQPIHPQKPWDHLDLFIWWRDTNFLMTGSQFSIIHQLSTHFPHILHSLRSRQVEPA